MPHEFAIGGVYFPPMLIASFIGVGLALLTGRILDRKGWTRHFFYSPLVLLSLMVIYTVLVGTFVISS